MLFKKLLPIFLYMYTHGNSGRTHIFLIDFQGFKFDLVTDEKENPINSYSSGCLLARMAEPVQPSD